MGTVTLIGAGPGTRDLLTQKGYERLQQADIVIYDRLIDADILSCIPDHAEQINVGKANHHHPVPQEQINELMVHYAKKGYHVVRLKGGDCFLFGRGGEECEYLLAHDIPFEVVPGVSSALAAPAYAGIPITHRDFCSSVHFITAHARAGKSLELDFTSLVRLNGTLVFFMGLIRLEELMQGLLDAGMSPSMPAAVIENGARAQQRNVLAEISTLAQRTREEKIQSPALIVVGKVCTLSKQLNWFEKQPLHGQTIVVTRPKERIGTLSKKLRQLGANVIECPCIQTVEQVNTQKLESALQQNCSWLVLTSPAGVHAMIHALNQIGRDLRVVCQCKFAVIGAGTAKELEQYGIRADLMPEVYDSKHLGELLAQCVHPTEKILILRAEQGSDQLLTPLIEKQLQFFDIAIYRTEYTCNHADEIKRMIKNNSVNVITFTSASTVTGFVMAIQPEQEFTFTALCIGKQTAEKAQEYGMKTKIAKSATIDSMITTLLEGNSHE